MEDGEKAFLLLEKIDGVLGFYGIIAFIILACTIIFGFIFIKSWITKAAQESSEKSLVLFKNDLDRKLETQLKLTFKDLDIRNQIHSKFGVESISVKIELWKEIYSLYFDYQEAWDKYDIWLTQKQKDYLNCLHKNRIGIFINSLYLGGELT
jgi:hypothetical protein